MFFFTLPFLSSHQSGMVHIFNKKQKNPPTFLLLDGNYGG